MSAPAKRRSSADVRRLAFAAIAGAVSVLAPDAAQSQVADVELGSSLYLEPSGTSQLTVVNPSAAVTASPADWLSVSATYDADIVSGATESIKGGPLSPIDIVSSATPFEDTRHVVGGGFTIRRDVAALSASYQYGTEHDYRSNAFAVTASTAFFQKNTELSLGYGRGFDRVCTTNYGAADAPSVRAALDSSDGCFTDAEDRASRAIDLDNFQAAWSQSWTPVFATQLVLGGALQHGFLENPYRSVVIAPAGDTALENHPDNRARATLALRAKYYLRAVATAFTGTFRLYRDTWDIWSQTYEVGAERYLLAPLRLEAHLRYYTQTEALFWSDDYTGGEPENGPRGQYWTGDRELSPLSTYLLGARFVFRKEGRRDARLFGALLGLQASAGGDLMRTSLKEFTWGGAKPSDNVAFLFNLHLRGEF